MTRRRRHGNGCECSALCSSPRRTYRSSLGIHSVKELSKVERVKTMFVATSLPIVEPKFMRIRESRRKIHFNTLLMLFAPLKLERCRLINRLDIQIRVGPFGIHNIWRTSDDLRNRSDLKVNKLHSSSLHLSNHRLRNRTASRHGTIRPATIARSPDCFPPPRREKGTATVMVSNYGRCATTRDSHADTPCATSRASAHRSKED